jgi:type II secretory pathway pseudopilin PulG
MRSFSEAGACRLRVLSAGYVARRRGFVLMEAVVALAIIGLVVIGLLSATGAQMRTASKARVLLTARALAEDRLSAVELLDYSALMDVPDSLAAGTFAAPFESFSWTIDVEPMEDEYDLFGAEVIVSGNGESFPLRTLIHMPKPVFQTTAGGQ